MALPKDGRSRNWELIVYPESAPSNWISILDEDHLCFAVSPLHDLDEFEDTGELKKPHFHVILQFAGKKSVEQIQDICDRIGHAQFSVVQNMRGAVRYLAHLDSPDKHRYNEDDIKVHGGFQLDDYFEIEKHDRYEYISQMREYIVENNFIDFVDFFTFCDLNKHNTWFRCLCDNSSYIIGLTIKSQRNKYFAESSNGRISDSQSED